MDLPLGWMVAGRPEGLGSCVQMCATMAVKHAQPSREGGLDMPRRAVKLLKRLQAYDVCDRGREGGGVGVTDRALC